MKKMVMAGLLTLSALTVVTGCSDEKSASTDEEKSLAISQDELPPVTQEQSEREALNAVKRFYSALNNQDETALKTELKEFLAYAEGDPQSPKELLNAYEKYDFLARTDLEIIPRDDLDVEGLFKEMYDNNARVYVYSTYTGSLEEGDKADYIFEVERSLNDGKFYITRMGESDSETALLPILSQKRDEYRERSKKPLFELTPIGRNIDYSEDEKYVPDEQLINLVGSLMESDSDKIGTSVRVANRFGPDEFLIKTDAGEFIVRFKDKGDTYAWIIQVYGMSDVVMKSASYDN